MSGRPADRRQNRAWGRAGALCYSSRRTSATATSPTIWRLAAPEKNAVGEKTRPFNAVLIALIVPVKIMGMTLIFFAVGILAAFAISFVFGRLAG